MGRSDTNSRRLRRDFDAAKHEQKSVCPAPVTGVPILAPRTISGHWPELKM